MSRFNKQKVTKKELVAAKVTPEIKQQLTNLAEKHKTTVSKILGTLIEEELKRDEEEDPDRNHEETAC